MATLWAFPDAPSSCRADEGYIIAIGRREVGGGRYPVPPYARSCSFPHQVEVDAVSAQLGEITRYRTEHGIVFHAYRDHSIFCDQPGIPDLTPLVGLVVTISIGHDILALDFADLRRTSEILMAVRRQGFPFNVGKAEII